MPNIRDYICTVTGTGTQVTHQEDRSYNVLIRLSSEGAFQDRWFGINPLCQREMHATALAAIAGDRRVSASLPDPPDEYRWIEALYILR